MNKTKKTRMSQERARELFPVIGCGGVRWSFAARAEHIGKGWWEVSDASQYADGRTLVPARDTWGAKKRSTAGGAALLDEGDRLVLVACPAMPESMAIAAMEKRPLL